MSRNLIQRYRALGDEPLYCEADPAEAIYEGSDDERYNDTWERKWAYERAAVNFLEGRSAPLMSARLRGPFDKASGWTNPWRSKKVRITKPLSSLEATKPTPQFAKGTKPRKTSVQSVQQESTICHLPSPVSLDNKILEPHPFLDDEDVARVEDWRVSVDDKPLQPDAFWAPSSDHISSRKRRARNSNWLKRAGKRRRTGSEARNTIEQSSPMVLGQLANGTGDGGMGTGDERMEEDELQADTESPLNGNEPIATPSRKSPTRRGLRLSPRNSASTEDSDDELSRPNDTAQPPRIWRTASARSQVFQSSRRASARSSPMKRFVRATTSTPAAREMPQAIEDGVESPEFVTQQDDSFIFRVRRKASVPDQHLPELVPSQRSSSPLSSAPDEISDFTSLGPPENEATVDDIVSSNPSQGLKSDATQTAHPEVVHDLLRATPEYSIVCTSQPGLEASTPSGRAARSATEGAAVVNSPEDFDGKSENVPTPRTTEQAVAWPANESEPHVESRPVTADVIRGNEPCPANEPSIPEAHNDNAIHNVAQVRQSEGAHDPVRKTSDTADNVAASLDNDLNSEVASPDGRSTASSEVQCRVEEQILLESTQLDEGQTVVSGLSGETTNLTTSAEDHISPSHPLSTEDEVASKGLEEPATPAHDKPSALAVSQQTPWQPSFQSSALDPSGALPPLRQTQASQSIASVTFSQGNGSIPPVSQQTPWYRGTPQPPFSQPSSPRPNDILDAVRSFPPSTQSPWSRSFEQMRAAAHHALFSTGISLSFSREEQMQTPQPLPVEMPEQSVSVASAETPSLHTAPSTPGQDAPAPVFEDASSSPREGRLTTSPQAGCVEEGFTLKPFSAFRSPSPEKGLSRSRKARYSRGSQPNTRGILTPTPRAHRSSDSHVKKRVSWALPDDVSESENNQDAPHSSGTSASSRARAASPPPELALADLPTGEKHAFQKHFSAVKMKAKGHSHRILPSASQRVLRSPEPMAMAEAFLAADEMARPGSAHGSEANRVFRADKGLLEEPQSDPATQEEEVDDVDEVLRNLGDFIDVVDVQADIQLAKTGNNGFEPGEKTKARALLTAQLNADVWDRF